MTQVCPFLGFSPVPSLMSRYCRPVLVLVIFFSFSVWPGSSARPPVAASKAIIARAATRRQRVEAVLESILVSVLLRRPAGRDLPGIDLPHLYDMIRACSHKMSLSLHRGGEPSWKGPSSALTP